MHAPLSMQELAHLREASGPSPVRKMSSTPVMTSSGSASARPAGATLGHASTHLPHRVQASSIASTRVLSAVSKVTSFIGGCLYLPVASPRVPVDAVNYQGAYAPSAKKLRSSL